MTTPIPTETGSPVRGLTGVVVAGGAASRLARPKPLVEIGGRSILARIVDVLARVCDELILAGRADQDDAVTDAARSLGMRVATDEYAGAGPIAGIEAGLTAANTEFSFVTGADQPFLSTQLIAVLAKAAAGSDALVPVVEGTLQPLHAVYGRTMLPTIREALEQARYSPLDMLKQAVTAGSPAIRIFEQAEAEKLDPQLLSFYDVDTPEQLEQAEAIARSQRPA